MLVSKIWVVLLAVAAVAGLAIARLVPNPASRELAQVYADKLDRGQHNADLILRLEARDWIDAAAKMAWDGEVIDLLEQSSNRRGDLKSHSAKLKGRLLDLVGPTRAEPRPLLIAVDHRGKQIARIGVGEERIKLGEDGLAGYPLVDAALRGYRSDDTWSLDGKLLLMAASPVISRSRGRYVGALLIGLDINDAFAQRLKSRLAGTDLSFFLRGSLVASTVRVDGLTRLPAEFVKRTDEITAHGRSAVIRLGAGNTAHTAILAALPGEAAAHGAFYAAVGSPVPAVGLGEMLGMLTSADFRWSEFPWPLLVGLLLIAVAISLALLRWEHDWPLARLLASAQKLRSGEASRLDEYGPGAYGHLARSLNEGMEKLRRGGVGRDSRPAATTPETKPHVDLAAVIGSTTIESPGVRPLGVIGADLEAVSPPMPVLEASDSGFAERPIEAGASSHRERAALSLGGPAERLFEPPAEDLPGGQPIDVPSLKLTVTSSRPSSSGLNAVPSSPGAAASSFDLEPGLGLASAATTGPKSSTAKALRTVRLPESEEAALSKPPPFSVAAPEPKPAEPKPSMPAANDAFEVPEATPVVAVNTEDEYYRGVFKDFLAVKQQCGESTSALTFERFVEKLRKNRDSLMKNYRCKSVKFQVYIKDGKAALKATPLKD